jgi:hypothetical protein
MDGDELPDADYETIYGAEALEARKRRRLLELEATVRRLERNLVEQAKRAQTLASEPSSRKESDD